MEAEPFILFGKDHVLAMVAVILVSVILPAYLKKTSTKTKDWFGYLLASTLILNELIIIYLPYWIYDRIKVKDAE
ncbi:MAG TPA: hypothetical protein EYN33_06270 [Gammaproteobacteria bacterium]|jgi:hypothetical protein|nr:hypothetical protein [Gammaproteobacteria bacterium]HIA43009.1 hypothetical protein [Gammaproteobacteria bacterium]HIA95563.1 hypothetical protein [Gammaproteobacteria bacterium]HIB74530.1 hypothetical protein [Gammaproteobacteria bacterium]HIG49192.1 hypothetical protein [Gammaproteobacteria bacterium]